MLTLIVDGALTLAKHPFRALGAVVRHDARGVRARKIRLGSKWREIDFLIEELRA